MKSRVHSPFHWISWRKIKNNHAVIYADGEDADWKTNPTSYQIKDKEVTAADTLSVVMAKGGGQAVSFIPITD